MAVNRDLIGQAATLDRSDRTVLDMDSSESPVHGQQEGSAYNGHFESVCYHPLFLFNDHGDCLAAKLRSGNVSSADDWGELLVPEIDRQQAEGQRVAFRADAAFARPAIYEALETRGVGYAIRIPANKIWNWRSKKNLFRSPGRPSRKPLVRYKSFQYQAESWTTPRRVVAKVEHHVGELFPRVGFIVTNLSLPNRAVVRFYKKRGRPSNGSRRGSRRRIGRAVVSSVPGERGPATVERAGLQPRQPVAAARPTCADRHWSLTSLQQRLVKTGGRWSRTPGLLAAAGRER